MHWHSIYSGPTTMQLRQILAQRAEFYLTADHDAVIDLIMDKIGYLVHVSTVTDALGWSRNKAIRILEEIAETFQLPTGTVNSPHGQGRVYMWGKVIESGTWSVSPDAESYSPVLATDTVPVPVPVSTPVPAPAPVPAAAPRTDLDAAAARALAETKLSKIEAARGLISYGVKELGMTAEAVADALILMSRSESTGLTRATLAAWVAPEPAPTPEDRVTPQNAERRCELAALAAARPELAPVTAVLEVLLDHKNVPTSERFVDTWAGKFQGMVGEFTVQDAYAAAAAAVARGALGLEDVASELSARKRAMV